jgi:hypothetical protein
MRERRVYDRRRSGLRTSVMLTRTLRSYVENGLRDLVDMSRFEPFVLEGDDIWGRDDVIEAHLKINGQDFCLHIEGTGEDDPDKPQRLLGVVHEQTGATVKGPLDPKTWQQIEALVRFAAK